MQHKNGLADVAPETVFILTSPHPFDKLSATPAQ